MSILRQQKPAIKTGYFLVVLEYYFFGGFSSAAILPE